MTTAKYYRDSIRPSFPELGPTYRGIRDEHIAAMVALRNGSAERELIARMVANHELVRCRVSPDLDPVQLSLGDEP